MTDYLNSGRVECGKVEGRARKRLEQQADADRPGGTAPAPPLAAMTRLRLCLEWLVSFTSQHCWDALAHDITPPAAPPTRPRQPESLAPLSLCVLPCEEDMRLWYRNAPGAGGGGGHALRALRETGSAAAAIATAAQTSVRQGLLQHIGRAEAGCGMR